MDETIREIIKDCFKYDTLDFENCSLSQCVLYQECYDLHKEEKEYIKLTAEEIPDEQLEDVVKYLDSHLIWDWDCLTNEQLHILYDMTEEDQLEFEQGIEDKILTMLIKRVYARRN